MVDVSTQAVTPLTTSSLESVAPDKFKTLIVVVPAYNEADRIQETIAALLELRDPLIAVGVELKVYVVDDGSRDETRKLASSAGADRVVRHLKNRGLGAAVRSGLNAARSDGADIVVKFDADLQHLPSDILTLIAPLTEDTADVVYGDRFKRIDYRMPFVRRVGNIVFTGLMRWLTGWDVRDSQPGIFAVNETYLKRFYIPGDYNYTQQILLDAYHKGMRFVQVPVAFRKRTTGKSFVSLRYPFKVVPQIVMVLVGVKPLRIFGSLGLMFLVLGGAVASTQFAMWLLGFLHKPVTNVNLVLGLCLFGLQTLFFGILADLIVKKLHSEGPPDYE